jgi:hypothetical protein
LALQSFAGGERALVAEVASLLSWWGWRESNSRPKV